MQEVDLYLRKSKVVRTADLRDLLSIEAQETTGRAWAAREGLRVRKVWVDNLSAWSDVVRPEFDKALAAVLNGEVPCLWNFAMDRFTRRGIDEIGPVLGKARVIFDYEGRGLAFEPIHTGGGYFALSLLIPGGEVLITDDDGQIARPAESHTAWLACFYPDPASPFAFGKDEVVDIYVGDGSLSLTDDCAACTESIARWLAAHQASSSASPLAVSVETEAAAPS
ncbi:recombinase family protein [Kitasatospora sp. NPDC057692]|uniref:recombinase family protein n=1 Tax=Kitasatospora sp. NPDC057692 TaxID=3346215 RepID=UPI00367B0A51